MRLTKYNLLTAAAIIGIATTGCEWTASDGVSAWSNKYDNMNFSGTYRITASADGTDTAVNNASGVFVGNWTGNTGSFTGTLPPDLVPSSVTISAGTLSWKDDGSEAFIGNGIGAGGGTISYEGGGFTVLTVGNVIPDATPVRATYKYNSVVGPTPEEGFAKSLTPITISQTGQNLKIIFASGYILDGKFTIVNELAVGYNAAFEVTGTIAGMKSKFVGTLDSSSGAQRVLNGTLMVGASFFDVHGTAPGAITGATVN